MSVIEERASLLADVRARRDFVGRRARRYRLLDMILLITSIVCGLLATGLAADAARGGTMAAQAAAASADGKPPASLGPGWRNFCGFVAVCSFLGTLAGAVNSGLKLGEHRAQAMNCAGRLDALHTELIAGKGETADFQTAKDEFVRVLREYPQYLR